MAALRAKQTATGLATGAKVTGTAVATPFVLTAVGTASAAKFTGQKATEGAEWTKATAIAALWDVADRASGFEAHKQQTYAAIGQATQHAVGAAVLRAASRVADDRFVLRETTVGAVANTFSQLGAWMSTLAAGIKAALANASRAASDLGEQHQAEFGQRAREHDQRRERLLAAANF